MVARGEQFKNTYTVNEDEVGAGLFTGEDVITSYNVDKDFNIRKGEHLASSSTYGSTPSQGMFFDPHTGTGLPADPLVSTEERKDAVRGHFDFSKSMTSDEKELLVQQYHDLDVPIGEFKREPHEDKVFPQPHSTSVGIREHLKEGDAAATYSPISGTNFKRDWANEPATAVSSSRTLKRPVEGASTTPLFNPNWFKELPEDWKYGETMDDEMPLGQYLVGTTFHNPETGHTIKHDDHIKLDEHLQEQYKEIHDTEGWRASLVSHVDDLVSGGYQSNLFKGTGSGKREAWEETDTHYESTGQNFPTKATEGLVVKRAGSVTRESYDYGEYASGYGVGGWDRWGDPKSKSWEYHTRAVPSEVEEVELFDVSHGLTQPKDHISHEWGHQRDPQITTERVDKAKGDPVHEAIADATADRQVHYAGKHEDALDPTKNPKRIEDISKSGYGMHSTSFNQEPSSYHTDLPEPNPSVSSAVYAAVRIHQGMSDDPNVVPDDVEIAKETDRPGHSTTSMADVYTIPGRDGLFKGDPSTKMMFGLEGKHYKSGQRPQIHNAEKAHDKLLGKLYSESAQVRAGLNQLGLGRMGEQSAVRYQEAAAQEWEVTQYNSKGNPQHSEPIENEQERLF